MILGIGTDLMDVSRMARELAGASGFREELFTAAEIAYCETCRHPARHYAARFAAKEALVKALGPEAPAGVAWREAEVDRDGPGGPRLRLHGRLREAAARLGVRNVFVSVSHTDALASATVVLEGAGAERGSGT
ncbi:holo-[acyl-carrier-protein] synthase [Acidobacteria bacterium ACD]|nr:MAG: holo-[acyl-carrier-protein] synthase [Acidobacteriota bacterium]MDL1952411.1 holo-[acyl-carrier-protein] synthase [Acidobacteria bacterium ACD]